MRGESDPKCPVHKAAQRLIKEIWKQVQEGEGEGEKTLKDSHPAYFIAICTLAVPAASISSLSNTIVSETHALKGTKDN